MSLQRGSPGGREVRCVTELPLVREWNVVATYYLWNLEGTYQVRSGSQQFQGSIGTGAFPTKSPSQRVSTVRMLLQIELQTVRYPRIVVYLFATRDKTPLLIVPFMTLFVGKLGSCA